MSTGQGWYVYIETSFPRQVNDTARILSPTIKADGSQKSIHCVSFWYHMYGPHVDTLRLYQKVGSTLGKPKWVRQGDQGNQWIQGEYTVEHTKDVQVRFSYALCLHNLLQQFGHPFLFQESNNFVQKFSLRMNFYLSGIDRHQFLVDLHKLG